MPSEAEIEAEAIRIWQHQERSIWLPWGRLTTSIKNAYRAQARRRLEAAESAREKEKAAHRLLHRSEGAPVALQQSRILLRNFLSEVCRLKSFCHLLGSNRPKR